MGLIKGFIALIFFSVVGIGLYAAVADFTGNDFLRLQPDKLVWDLKEQLFNPKSSNSSASKSATTSAKPRSNKPLKLKFAVMSDTHSDTGETAKAIRKAKAEGVKLILLTGDLTQVGAIDELTEQRDLFKDSGIEYHVIPGDHDLYNSAGTRNFIQVFGPTHESFSKENIHFLLLDASDSLKGLGDEQLAWAKNELQQKYTKATFVFMHLPPYHPSSTRTIYQKHQKPGDTNEKAKTQAHELLKAIKQDDDKAEVFSGDHHLSNKYNDPDFGVPINIVGAVTSERNLQTSRFDVVEVYDDYSYIITEVEIDE